ncbi:N-acetylmuramoyl-L-alanine amidase family protein [Granulicella mallensis]|uniref:N-acetylmuramoyl-L-alanine amidase n=1 Tax=Granulicella mallensis (strain ATCC BAA-1857 / DSM 23137 / MP5ACTX8) TaxID=682795 RepID=G8P1Z3_GRAMM|nr:N-acetylmuramoyl-L-alanine amidase [Granulicella mallensis]AEU37045.1 cell wall hydrolase/autolysin [Granulicella mallensis MP5ACTX8]
MNLAQKSTICLLALATLPCLAQTAAPPAQAPPAPKQPTSTAKPLAPLPPSPFNRTTILLDPAHGGADSGSRISDTLLEKDITLSLAFKLRSLLAARGFTVVMTRDSDAATQADTPTPLTLDDRAGIANRAHPVACLLLHATAAGRGVHLYRSELDPIPYEVNETPWLTAQAAWVTQSQNLQKQLGMALTRAHVPLVFSRASVRPVDSFACPALVVELAPKGSDNSTLTDDSYQQQVARAIAAALVFWQNQAQPPQRLPAVQTPATAPETGAQP